jgi:predicted methyltransferase
MEAVEDDIAPEQHVAWDEEVKKRFPADIERGSIPDLSILISAIIRHSSNMNGDYQHLERAEKLLKKTHGLKEELEDAWGKGKFKRIRLLSSSRHLSSD